jgi:hypothetical protein
MSQQHESSRVLIVVERGADWPSWVSACRRNPKGRLVVEQGDEASLGDLAQRVAQCVRNEAFSTVVLACGERSDEGATVARLALSRDVLAGFNARGTGQLWLALRDRASGRARHQLSQLARELAEHLVQHASVSVQVRFGAGLSANAPSFPGHAASAA